MNKTKVLFGILAICLMSITTFAQYENAHCYGSYKITDLNYNSVTDTYQAALEIISLKPTDGGVGLPAPNLGPTQYAISNAVVTGVWYQTPTSADYYTMKVIVYKYINGVYNQRSEGTSYAAFTYTLGYYVMTANNIIPVDFP